MTQQNQNQNQLLQQQTGLISADSEVIGRLNSIVKGAALSPDADVFTKMIVRANAIAQLKQVLTPEVMAPVMSLQGSGLGFKTDKDKTGGYPVNVVQDCVIEAALRGLQVVGNQFNIIAGNFYVAKSGANELLKKIPGLKFTITPGDIEIVKEPVPASQTHRGIPGKANITMTVEWTYGGRREKTDVVFPIKVNNDMTDDAVIGKATRKARMWLYERISGEEVADAEVGEGERIIDVTPKESRFERKPEKTVINQPDDNSHDGTAKVARALKDMGADVTVEDIMEWCRKTGNAWVPDMALNSLEWLVNETVKMKEAGK